MPGFGILALCGYGSLRGGATGGPLRWLWRRRNGFLYGFESARPPPPFRVMSCNDVPVFWDDHCEYRDIFKKGVDVV